MIYGTAISKCGNGVIILSVKSQSATNPTSGRLPEWTPMKHSVLVPDAVISGTTSRFVQLPIVDQARVLEQMLGNDNKILDINDAVTQDSGPMLYAG